MTNNNHKKLIVFDINLDWKQGSERLSWNKDIDDIFALFKKASQFQTVVLTTSGCFFDAVDFVVKSNIDKGYLITNGGALIYDIAAKKIIAEHYLSKADVKALFHHGFTMGLNIVFSAKTNKYIFVSNRILFEKLKKDIYSPCTVIESYKQLNEILENEDILDLSYSSIYQSGADLIDSLQLYNVERVYDNEVCNFIPKINRTSMFIHFGSKESTKYKAIQTVMSYANIDSPNDVLYVAASCCNKLCYIAFKNSLISSDPVMLLELGNNKKHRYISEEMDHLDDKFGLESDSFWK